MIGRTYGLFLLLTILAACAGSQEKKPKPTGIIIDGVTIRNQLAYPVRDVQLLVPATGNFVGCGLIMARSDCATEFPGRDYFANAAVITWIERDQPQTTGEFKITNPGDLVPGKSTRLEIIIFNQGQAGAQLIQ